VATGPGRRYAAMAHSENCMRPLLPVLLLLVAGCGRTLPAGIHRDEAVPPPAKGGSEGTPARLFSVQGTVTQGLVASPSSPLEVGVLWLNRVEADNTVLVETTPADAIGATLPADFDVSILRAPSDAMLGTTLLSYTEDGRSTWAADRNRVAFGLVVVAPEGTFANLPGSVSFLDFIQASQGGPGPLLQQFTYVSPYTVRYVKGATAEGLTIRDINGVESVLEDMTVYEVSAWATGITAAVCRDRILGEGWSTSEVNDCIAAQTAANPYRGSGDIGNECLYAWQQANLAAFDTACGPSPDFAASDFRNSPRLAPSAPLTLPLGVNDVRDALSYGGFIFID